MDKFLETYKLPKLKQEEIENLNRLITSKEIESVIKEFWTNPSPGPDGFRGQFYQAFKGRLSTYSSQTVPKKQKRKENFQIHFMRPVLPWYQNQIKTPQRELQASISGEPRCKNPQQNTSKLNPTIH